MTKYHINDKGQPSVCRATKGNCPFGGPETHFKSQADAQIEVDKRNEAEYSLLPGNKHSKSSRLDSKYGRFASEKDKEYMTNRKSFLKRETSAPTYIEKCRSCTRMEDTSFYEKDKTNTKHFEKERKTLANKLENIYGVGDSVGFYEVDHQVKGNYRKQIIEIKSTGQLVIYDRRSGNIVTTFMGHRARSETMMILAGEIPTEDFMRTAKTNHTKDLSRQSIDRRNGGY